MVSKRCGVKVSRSLNKRGEFFQISQKIRRKRRFEGIVLPEASEAQSCRMKKMSFRRQMLKSKPFREAVTIEAIPDDRMAQRKKVYTDLMCPSCFREYPYQIEISIPRFHFIIRSGGAFFRIILN